MAWVALLSRVLSHLILPFILLLRCLLAALAPVLHLGSYIIPVLLFPLRLLAKFETLYIYLGTAALVGLITGFILHLSSTVLASLLNLNAISEDRAYSPITVTSAPKVGKPKKTRPSSSFREDQPALRSDASLENKYVEWLEKDVGKHKEDRGLLGQTIIEEDDDDSDGF